MSDTSPYGYLGNATDQGVTADQLVGEHAGSVTAHQASPQFSRAALSTAPYKPPQQPMVEPPPAAEVESSPVVEVRSPATPDTTMCKFKNCKQPAVAGFQYCGRHP